MRRWCLAGLIALIVGGCGGDRSGSGSPVCVPGQAIACVGPGGCQGGQACRSDGSGYEPCVCGGAFDAGPPMDARPGVDAALDAPWSFDAALDAPWSFDAAAPDAPWSADASPPTDARDAASDADLCSHCGTLACCSGICTDTSSDTNNCGACGTTCLPGAAPDCVLGVCGCMSNFGQACAAGATCCTNGCKDLMTDELNCGACGTLCAAGHSCNNGLCSCGGTTCTGSQICCSNRCVDKNTDNNNCGACGNQCISSATCLNGLCQGNTTVCNGVVCPTGQQCCPDVCCSLCTGGICMDSFQSDAGP